MRPKWLMSVFSSVAGADGGPAGSCGLSLHCGGLQLLQEVLQQERGRGWAGHEVRWHDDGESFWRGACCLNSTSKWAASWPLSVFAQCYLFHMYVGVRAGGGIGDEIEDPAGDPYELYRILFDITFFFFVIVILLAIIQGELRHSVVLKAKSDLIRLFNLTSSLCSSPYPHTVADLYYTLYYIFRKCGV